MPLRNYLAQRRELAGDRICRSGQLTANSAKQLSRTEARRHRGFTGSGANEVYRGVRDGLVPSGESRGAKELMTDD
jgi:hypothetical protein